MRYKLAIQKIDGMEPFQLVGCYLKTLEDADFENYTLGLAALI